MIIPLPEQVGSRLTAQDAALHLALGLFVDQRVTLGQAAEVAGLSQSEFLRELGHAASGLNGSSQSGGASQIGRSMNDARPASW